MKKIIKLTERDLTRIVKRVISESVKTVNVEIDCTKKTINGKPIMTDELHYHFCERMKTTLPQTRRTATVKIDCTKKTLDNILLNYVLEKIFCPTYGEPTPAGHR